MRVAGARMYIAYSSRDAKDGIPRDIDGQAEFWKKYYRPSGDIQDYLAAADALEKGRDKSLFLVNFFLSRATIIYTFQQV